MQQYPEFAQELFDEAEKDAKERLDGYRRLAMLND